MAICSIISATVYKYLGKYTLSFTTIDSLSTIFPRRRISDVYATAPVLYEKKGKKNQTC